MKTKEQIVWADNGIEVVYCHDNDNFELWVCGYMGWEFRGEFDKSADAVKSAQNLERYEG